MQKALFSRLMPSFEIRCHAAFCFAALDYVSPPRFDATPDCCAAIIFHADVSYAMPMLPRADIDASAYFFAATFDAASAIFAADAEVFMLRHSYYAATICQRPYAVELPPLMPLRYNSFDADAA